MVNEYNILVTGFSGQLGNQISKIASEFEKYQFIFTDKDELNISNYNLVNKKVKENRIDILINCAAYTDVQKAEFDRDNADLINNISVAILARVCFENKVQLIHISSDFIFDGLKNSKYNEIDEPNPINFYGLTKLNGERKILDYNLKKSIIIRTSWLYSELENNFVSKILTKINSNQDIKVIGDEYGSPTNARDLARTILELIPKLSNKVTEIYHYCNTGICSRFDLANEINLIVNGKSKIISTNFLDSKLKRPKFSALNTFKIRNQFNLEIKDWKRSLHDHFNELRMKNYKLNEIY